MKSKIQEKRMIRQSLDNLILSVKSDIIKVEKSNNYNKSLLLADIETHIRLIGAQIELMV